MSVFILLLNLWIIPNFISDFPKTCKKIENQQSSARICTRTSDKQFLLLSSSVITQKMYQKPATEFTYPAVDCTVPRFS
jgi:hypothetical protein